MIRTFLLAVIALIIGSSAGYVTLRYVSQVNGVVSPVSQNGKLSSPSSLINGSQKPDVIGFLPYWLVDKAKEDYSPYITELTYFSLSVDTDGSIQKLINEQETEPGWNALKSGKIDSDLTYAKNKHIRLSIAVFSGNEETIARLMDDPVSHAQNLMNDLDPVISRYDFSDVNLDIESVQQASPESQLKFTTFVKEFQKRLKQTHKNVTLSIDVAPIMLLKPYLVDMKQVDPYVDQVILMAYDYHYSGSSVTGPVAPLTGAITDLEFDTQTAVGEALTIMPAHKIILGAPLYGYEWETIASSPYSGTIPGSGIVASTKRVEDFISGCSSCSATFDPKVQESYLIYKDQETNSYHQIFYPTLEAIQAKTEFAKEHDLGGMALWALGYESPTILNPLSTYKQ